MGEGREYRRPKNVAFGQGFGEENHVFEARQQTNTIAPTSRFRPTYRALTPEEKALHDEIKAKAVELETLISRIDPRPAVPAPVGRYMALAYTDLELAVMWAVKALTS